MSVEVILIVLIGLITGGIVNMLADDLPHRSAVRPPHYPDGTPRPVTAWLGLSAFLLGQRTSPEDGSKLSWRYPITELGTATLMVIAYYAAQAENVSTLQTAFWLIYMAVFVLITVIDIEHKLILFVVIVPSCVLAILDAILTSFQPTLVDALIGGAAGFLVFFLMYNGGYLFTYVIGKLRGREIREVAFGYGDVMMATLSGLILGWRALIFAMFITVFLGAFGALIYMFSRRFIGRRYSAFTAIPYGPYIVAGTILMLLYRVEVRQAIFGW